MLTKTRAWFVDFVMKEDGPTAVEYAVMLAMIIVICIASIQILGQNVNTVFSQVSISLAASGS